MTRGLRPIFLAAVPAGFLGIFFLYPVISIVGRGLSGEGFSRLTELASSATFRGVVWFTFWQATVSTCLTVFLAFPGSYLLARYQFRGKALLRALTTVPFVLPTVVVGSAFSALFGRLSFDSGALGLHHTVWAIIGAHVFFNIAVILRTVGAFWEGLDPLFEEQAYVLGTGKWRTFRMVTLPRLGPAIAASASIVFLFCTTSFGVILILGGSRRATLETEIWRHAVWRGDMRSATAMALVQLMAVVAMVVVSNWLQRKRGIVQRRSSRSQPRPSRSLLLGNLTLLTVVLALPILVLFERSIAVKGGYSFRNYLALIHKVDFLPVSVLATLKNSLIFAVIATILAVVVGGLAAFSIVNWRGWWAHMLDLGMMLPLGVSAVTLGFGMLVALDQPPLDLRTSRWLVPVAHSLIGVPFVIRILLPALRSIDNRLREAAAVLGASPFRVVREIDLQIVRKAAVVSAAFAFAVSLGEFGATSFLPRHPDRITAPVALFRLLGTPGDLLRGQAMALAVVLMLLTGTCVLLIELFGRSRLGNVRGDL